MALILSLWHRAIKKTELSYRDCEGWKLKDITIIVTHSLTSTKILHTTTQNFVSDHSSRAQFIYLHTIKRS